MPPADTCKYSGWTIWAAYQRGLVTGDTPHLVGMLDDFVAYYTAWEQKRLNPDGSFWQHDVRDAMEESISGSRTDRNLRPPLNSYMYGNAAALAKIATLAGRADLATEYSRKAEGLKRFVEEKLWDDDAKFFKVRFVHPGRPTDNTLSDAREEIGFIPWYFDLPERGRGYEAAWAQLIDVEGFKAPFGITTAERRHPRFRFHDEGGCEWNGPVWPFATSQTLTGLANVLNDREQSVVTKQDYFDALRTYARSTYRHGKPYIGEYLDERTGEWLHKDPERGRYYNHSTFCDLVISGLVGLRPGEGNTLRVNPLVPAGTWDWFCLDGVPYRGRSVTVLWDRTGERYRRGAGLSVLIDGVLVSRADRLEGLTVHLAE
ncbi:MAG: trehalase family glycosidase [Tepidisphaeraceae bacterium]